MANTTSPTIIEAVNDTAQVAIGKASSWSVNIVIVIGGFALAGGWFMNTSGVNKLIDKMTDSVAAQTESNQKMEKLSASVDRLARTVQESQTDIAAYKQDIARTVDAAVRRLTLVESEIYNRTKATGVQK
jgi:outer membrane murein-binding lipoprotein Lpp